MNNQLANKKILLGIGIILRHSALRTFNSYNEIILIASLAQFVSKAYP